MTKEIVAGHRVSYAQNREDIILAAFFEETETGFYVDVGANDPEVDSVTKYFYDKGWSGINIEPQAEHFKNLEAHRPRDINLNIGVGERAGTLELRQYSGDGLSTFSDAMKKDYASHPNEYTKDYHDVTVSVKTLKKVFMENNVEAIDFIKIDVEGFEYEAIVGNDWEKYRPKVICIESNHIKKDWHDFLVKQNYELSFHDGLNEYFTDKHRGAVRDKFSYVDAVVLGKPIISRIIAQVVSDGDKKIKTLSTQNEALVNDKKILEEEIANANSHVVRLESELNEIISLKAHIKKFTKIKLQLLNKKIESKLQPRGQFIPVKPSLTNGDLLKSARQADIRNLDEYNQMFSENAKVRAYRKIKQATKKTLKKRTNR